ncbi:tail fiber protein [Luteibaculum oceani]|uniref:Tail fiber protein n=1 Tax=Luteibaculum oceani TaxID=1294296 RepID=A0A5C6V133_9FLAO|nr:tail fiber protein [Luteibaculum oceani]TXC78674.1 tail fiber protein [Luteibaculum oceani]
MKSLYTFLATCLITISGFAQDINIAGFNFQGYAIDNEGKAITTENVTVTFTIGSFVEEHSLTTDAFGVFNAVIGTVKPTDFRKLDFKNPYEALSLKVQVQKNSGAQVTIFNGPLQSVPYARSAENGVPVGTIIAFSGAVAPKGWLLCDGKTYNKTDFPRLEGIIGSSWGNNGGSTFKVPDLRGRFLRGAGAGSTGLTGANIPELGKAYGDQNKSHNHKVTVRPHTHNFTDIFHSEGAFGVPGGAGSEAVPGNKGSGATDEDNVGYNKSKVTNSTTAIADCESSGGAEARPHNAAVTYIIKY